MMQFPITDLLDEHECYRWLLGILHPDGLKCAHGHPLPPGQAPHDRTRAPVVDYRCRACGNVFHIFTDTVWSGSHYDCKTITLVMRAFIQGTPTLHIAQEMELDYETLLERRKRVQRLAFEQRLTDPLEDENTEADEMFQNAGEKGDLHDDPADPPRRRANKRPGKGTMDNDRPPVLGVVGRESGKIRLTVCDNTQKVTIQPQVNNDTEPTATLYTDECSAYHGMATAQRHHATVCHSQKEWARDDACPELVEGTAMASAKSIATQWRGLGRVCAISCVRFAACTRSISNTMWRCLSGLTISSESPPTSYGH